MKPRETVALESINKGPPVASNETVGMHATLVGVVLAKDGQTFTLQIEKAVPGKDNEFPDLDSLVGKSIRVPLTLNPSWKQRAAADLDSLHPGERVGARVIYSKYLKGPGLLEITDIPRP